MNKPLPCKRFWPRPVPIKSCKILPLWWFAKRRAFALADMATQYGVLVAGSRDEMIAHVTAAQDLSGAQITALKGELNKVFDKNVIVEAATDASLLGGMIVESRQPDD